jgi:acetate kinase
VERALDALTELAPLHNTPALEALRTARVAFPNVPHVAVFDTAFHATLAPTARTYALPARLRELGIRRFGFHGLSVQWAAERVPVPRLVVFHLGGGCSVTAVLDGRSVDTTMGYTPLEGVPMATRSGSIDPGALLALVRNGHLSVDDLEHALEHESGLLGLGGSADVAELERATRPDADLALAVFAHRVAGAGAAMAVAAGGLDAIVFTGGIGEHSGRVRAAIAGRLSFLGVDLDEAANADASPDADVGRAGSAVRVVVIRSREEIVAARAARVALR